MKKIFTHLNPDLDAVAGAWIIKKFLPGWEEAEIGFVEASKAEALRKKSKNDALFIDTGMGELDHHQSGVISSATKKCFLYVLEKRSKKLLADDDRKVLEEIAKTVTDLDNARDLVWPEISLARSDFYLHSLLAGIRGVNGSDDEIISFGFRAMDSAFYTIKKRFKAIKEIKEKGSVFMTSWGKAIALETGNDAALFEGERQGYCLVVRKDKDTGGVRIYSRWDCGVDLTKAYKTFKKLDPKSDWFLHASKCLLLNMATQAKMKPTKLSIAQVIDVLKARG